MDDRTIPRGVAAVDSGQATVHFDGACEPPRGGGVATYGFVVQGPGLYHEGGGLAVAPHAPHATNNVAEYVGAICALEWLSGQGFRGAVTIIGDSQLVIRQMQGEYRVRASHLEAYHERLTQLGRAFERVEYRWVRREANRRADELSKIALEEARAQIGQGTERAATEELPDAGLSDGRTDDPE